MLTQKQKQLVKRYYPYSIEGDYLDELRYIFIPNNKKRMAGCAMTRHRKKKWLPAMREYSKYFYELATKQIEQIITSKTYFDDFVDIKDATIGDKCGYEV